MEQDCLFCKISQGSLSADVVLETDEIISFRDIHPKAKVHTLIVPKKHIESLAHAEAEDAQLMGKLMLAVGDVTRALDIDESGYRTIINTRHNGGQEVNHLHIHVLGGEPLGPMTSV